MVNLPRYVALKSKYNNNYLRYVNEASQVQKFLQYSGESVLTPYTVYELEQAKCDPSLVNIRCAYNNKYWVSWPSDHHFIVAQADNIEEDKSKWNCTLFQPIYDSNNQAFRFRHVYLGFNVCLWRGSAPYVNCLRAQWSTPDGDLCDLSTPINWGTLLSLPKHIVFKGDNGYYLSAQWIEEHQYLQFASNDIGDPTVGMETFITKDGHIRLKSNYFGKFWRRSPNWIWADSTDTTTNNSDTLFLPTKVDKNVVALRNMGNNNFIKRLTADGKTSCLNAAVNTIDGTARLQFEESVLSREIYNVKFRPSDSRIYDQSTLVMATETATNTTKESHTMNLKFTYTETKSSMWNSSVSIKLGVKTTVQTGIPFIVDGKVEISATFSGQYQWGETKTTSKVVETLYQVTVPSMTTVIVSLLATQGTSDVPYSYTQCDTLINGEIKSYQMDDGVYKGVNSYNFKYETKSKPITA
ncbi:uncharacterized protein LOC111784384 [Cucurbita pepo subsp. pepo]|uniref:uncharacterized protein LOC111784384 n=1 Tax=Cucurbita pepo subsp. pepo TaxID=3664 RepID=UPI000C9D8E48|nr:uncharacterized protein LOC111784384 [Cucurbita pepo subsp. pepo]